jgi:hypothetical protein
MVEFVEYGLYVIEKGSLGGGGGGGDDWGQDQRRRLNLLGAGDAFSRGARRRLEGV